MTLSNTDLKNIARQVKVSKSTVSAVIDHMRPRINQMAEQKIRIGHLLKKISSAYYGFDTGNETINLATTMVMDKFHDLTTTDIEEAYKTVAAGSLGDGYRIKGRFTVTDMANILSAFRPIRNRILDEARAATATALPGGTEPLFLRSGARKYRNNEEFYADLPRLIREFYRKDKEWTDMPAFWYGACQRAGIINELDLEPYRKRAEKMAAAQVRRDRISLTMAAYEEILASGDHVKRTRQLMAKMALYTHLQKQYA